MTLEQNQNRLSVGNADLSNSWINRVKVDEPEIAMALDLEIASNAERPPENRIPTVMVWLRARRAAYSEVSSRATVVCKTPFNSSRD